MKKFLKALFSPNRHFTTLEHRVEMVKKTPHKCETCKSIGKRNKKTVCIKNSFFNPIELEDYCEQWFPREEFLE